MDADFEAQVLSKLVLTINVPGPDGVPIGKEDIGNIMFTNDVIKMAATEVQSLPAWQMTTPGTHPSRAVLPRQSCIQSLGTYV